MQTIRYIMSGAAGLLLLNSCVKDELYKTPHPDKGRITITADWSHRSTDCPLPEEYVLLHSCCEVTALKVPADREFCHPSLFEPNSHTLIAWNEADGITIDHTTAHINTVEGDLLESLPGYLLTEAQNINVIKDDTLEVEIYMKQKTRDLLFELTVKEGDPNRISNITGTLSGIVGSFDLSSQRICGEAMNTSFPFARTNDKVTAHTRLLGTTGLKQSLRIDLTFTDGSSQTIENDLTDPHHRKPLH